VRPVGSRPEGSRFEEEHLEKIYETSAKSESTSNLFIQRWKTTNYLSKMQLNPIKCKKCRLILGIFSVISTKSDISQLNFAVQAKHRRLTSKKYNYSGVKTSVKLDKL